MWVCFAWLILCAWFFERSVGLWVSRAGNESAENRAGLRVIWGLEGEPGSWMREWEYWSEKMVICHGRTSAQKIRRCQVWWHTCVRRNVCFFSSIIDEPHCISHDLECLPTSFSETEAHRTLDWNVRPYDWSFFAMTVIVPSSQKNIQPPSNENNRKNDQG